MRLSNADVLGSDHSTNTPDEDGKYRLSWHVGQGENDGGWRAGQHVPEQLGRLAQARLLRHVLTRGESVEMCAEARAGLIYDY